MTRRLIALLAGLAILVGTAPPARAATSWGLRITGDTVGARIISNTSGATVRIELTNRTAVIETDPYVAAILKAVGLDTGYSQVATWQASGGPAIACPSAGVNWLCWSTSSGGKAALIRSIRGIVVAEAPAAAGSTTITVATSRESIAIDVTLAAIAIALDALGGSLTANLLDEALALAFELYPEAAGIGDALGRGDVAAIEELKSLAVRTAAIIIEHLVSWGLSTAVAAVFPPALAIRIGIGVIKVAPSLGNLVVAALSGRHSTVSVGYGTAAPAPSGSTASGSAADQGFGTEWVADWSAGLGGWSKATGWTAVNGMLVSDGGGREPILAPYSVPGTDYAVEAEIEMVRIAQEGSIVGRADMGLMARVDDGGKGGFTAGYCTNALVMVPCSNSADRILGIFAGYDQPVAYSPVETNRGSRTYRLLVQGTRLTLYVDGALVASGTDNRYLSGTRVGLVTNGIQISVRSFRVLSP